jgi:iron complex outermembrane receptor protein
MSSVRILVSLISGLVVSFLIPQAYAAESSAGVIEEIIVTAQKREQNLQEAPVSVTAFTGDAIIELGFRPEMRLSNWDFDSP